MSDIEQTPRSRIARRVIDLWGHERSEPDTGLIESASQALARIEELRPNAAAQLDPADEETRG
ncbi:MAG: hypothetical protein WEC79_09085 [Thermomicrobiales bacterium]